MKKNRIKEIDKVLTHIDKDINSLFSFFKDITKEELEGIAKKHVLERDSNKPSGVPFILGVFLAQANPTMSQELLLIIKGSEQYKQEKDTVKFKQDAKELVGGFQKTTDMLKNVLDVKS